jgi:DNA-binding NarL/FixJ family response regulator
VLTARADRVGESAVVRVLVVDDDARVRRGLRAVIERSADLLIAGEAATPGQALELDLALQPDVAVVDLLLPRATDGMGLVAALKVRGRPVIAISMRASLQRRALAVGADVFLVKDGLLVDDLIGGIHAVAAGR